LAAAASTLTISFFGMSSPRRLGDNSLHARDLW